MAGNTTKWGKTILTILVLLLIVILGYLVSQNMHRRDPDNAKLAKLIKEYEEVSDGKSIKMMLIVNIVEQYNYMLEHQITIDRDLDQWYRRNGLKGLR
jgi:hypothetical protein